MGLRFRGSQHSQQAACPKHASLPPIRPVGGSSMASSAGGYSHNMSQTDYNRWRDGGGGGRGRR